MAKKKKSVKINIGALIAFVGAILAVVAFFVPTIVQKDLEISLSGIEFCKVLFETAEGVDGFKITAAIEALKALNEDAAMALMIMTFVSLIVAGLYAIYSVAGAFVKQARSKMINLIFAGALLGLGIALISCAGVLQDEATTEILGKKIVAFAMSAGPFLTAIGGGIGVASFLFYKK